MFFQDFFKHAKVVFGLTTLVCYYILQIYKVIHKIMP